MHLRYFSKFLVLGSDHNAGPMVAIGTFIAGMIHGVMLRKFAAKLGIAGPFIGHDVGFASSLISTRWFAREDRTSHYRA